MTTSLLVTIISSTMGIIIALGVPILMLVFRVGMVMRTIQVTSEAVKATNERVARLEEWLHGISLACPVVMRARDAPTSEDKPLGY